MSIESAPTDKTESLPGWEGDWLKGERPEGYRPTTKRCAKLEKIGFDLDYALGQKFADQYIEIIKKGKTGKLTGQEVEHLLELNDRYHKAMDEFVKTL